MLYVLTFLRLAAAILAANLAGLPSRSGEVTQNEQPGHSRVFCPARAALISLSHCGQTISSCRWNGVVGAAEVMFPSRCRRTSLRVPQQTTSREASNPAPSAGVALGMPVCLYTQPFPSAARSVLNWHMPWRRSGRKKASVEKASRASQAT
jgi:hypothetical protein